MTDAVSDRRAATKTLYPDVFTVKNFMVHFQLKTEVT